MWEVLLSQRDDVIKSLKIDFSISSERKSKEKSEATSAQALSSDTTQVHNTESSPALNFKFILGHFFLFSTFSKTNDKIAYGFSEEKEKEFTELLNLATDEIRNSKDASKNSNEKLSEAENLLNILRDELNISQQKVDSIENDLNVKNNKTIAENIVNLLAQDRTTKVWKKPTKHEKNNLKK